MISSSTRSLPYCLGGLKTVHGRYVVDGRLFVQTEEPSSSTTGTEYPNGPLATSDMTMVSIRARSRTPGLGATSWCNHPSQTFPRSRHAEQNIRAQASAEPHSSMENDQRGRQEQPGTEAAELATFHERRRLHEVIQFRTYAHPRERGGRLFHSLGVGITELLERCIIREGSLCIFEPMNADWGGFPTATLLMLLGVPASGAAAALAEAFAPLDRQESQRRQSTLTELLTEMERLYGSSVRFALAHGSDAALLGNLRFAYLAR
jgi:hypothetical protein